MIDFTNTKEEFNTYSGSEKKKTLIYNEKKYLVKFPDPIREKNKNISYINNAFSEYIGSNIFKICGFNTQETILGKYNYKGNEKIVCACQDFTSFTKDLFEFSNLALSFNPDKKIETEITDIMEVLEESKTLIKIDDIKEKFWDMFIIDTLIGNTNRHNGNWGFIFDSQADKFYVCPIYDCGSCLNPTFSDEDMEKTSENELKNIALNTHSCLKENNKKINSLMYIKSMKNILVNEALKKTFPNINIEQIITFINNIDCISQTRKDFYTKILKIRYQELAIVYQKLNSN